MVQPRGLGQQKQCCNPDVLVNNTPLKFTSKVTGHAVIHSAAALSCCKCSDCQSWWLLTGCLGAKRLIFWPANGRCWMDSVFSRKALPFLAPRYCQLGAGMPNAPATKGTRVLGLILLYHRKTHWKTQMMVIWCQCMISKDLVLISKECQGSRYLLLWWTLILDGFL